MLNRGSCTNVAHILRKSGAGYVWRCSSTSWGEKVARDNIGDVEMRGAASLTFFYTVHCVGCPLCGALCCGLMSPSFTLATVKLVSVWPLRLLHCHCHLAHSLTTVWWVLWCGVVQLVWCHCQPAVCFGFCGALSLSPSSPTTGVPSRSH